MDRKSSETINKQEADVTKKIEHLKFIQSIINRLADNSQSTKRLSIILVFAGTAFGKYCDKPMVIGIAGFFLLIFMCLQDTQYLKTERAYRELHKDIINDKRVKDFDLDPKPYLAKVPCPLNSWSVWLFYLPLSLFMLFCSIYLT